MKHLDAKIIYKNIRIVIRTSNFSSGIRVSINPSRDKKNHSRFVDYDIISLHYFHNNPNGQLKAVIDRLLYNYMWERGNLSEDFIPQIRKQILNCFVTYMGV
jgi:hypothetical protein